MLNISLKYFVSLPIAILFISATNPSEFAASLSSIGISSRRLFRRAGAALYSRISSGTTTASARLSRRAVSSWAKRNTHAAQKFCQHPAAVDPSSLNRIDVISSAMELRGFGKHKKRTWYTKRSFARNDFIVLGLGVVLLGVSLTVTILFGIFYNPFV